MNMKNLNFNTEKLKLNDSDIDQLVDIIGSRCQYRTKARLRSILTYPSGVLNIMPTYGILERLTKEGEDWSYRAGQSYPDEIRTIREIILEGK